MSLRPRCETCGADDLATTLIRCRNCGAVHCNRPEATPSHIIGHLQATGHTEIAPITTCHLQEDDFVCTSCGERTIWMLGYLPLLENECQGFICCAACSTRYSEQCAVDQWRKLADTCISPFLFPGLDDDLAPQPPIISSEGTQLDQLSGAYSALYYLPSDLPAFDMSAYNGPFFTQQGLADLQPVESDTVPLTAVDQYEQSLDEYLENVRAKANRTRALERERRKQDDQAEKARLQLFLGAMLKIDTHLTPLTSRVLTNRNTPGIVLWLTLNRLKYNIDFEIERKGTGGALSVLPKSPSAKLIFKYAARQRLHYFHYFLPIMAHERFAQAEQAEKEFLVVQTVQYRTSVAEKKMTYDKTRGGQLTSEDNWEILVQIPVSRDHKMKVYPSDRFVLSATDLPSEVIEELQDSDFAVDRYTRTIGIPVICSKMRGDVAHFILDLNCCKSTIPKFFLTRSLNEPCDRDILLNAETVSYKFTENARLDQPLKHKYFQPNVPVIYELARIDNDASFQRACAAIYHLAAYTPLLKSYFFSDTWLRFLQCSFTLIHKPGLDKTEKVEKNQCASFAPLIRYLLLGDLDLASAYVAMTRKELVTEDGHFNLDSESTIYEGLCLGVPIAFNNQYYMQHDLKLDPVSIMRLYNLRDLSQESKQASPPDLRKMKSMETLVLGGERDPFSVMPVPHGDDETIPDSVPTEYYRATFFDRAQNQDQDQGRLLSPEIGISTVISSARRIMIRSLREKKSVTALINKLNAHLFECSGKALNESQQRSIDHALSAPISLIQGPPGCGKSFVAASLAWALNRAYSDEKLGRRGKILICCPSNPACDSISLALLKYCGNLKLLRVLSRAREHIFTFQGTTCPEVDKLALNQLVIAGLNRFNSADTPCSPLVPDLREFVPKVTSSLVSTALGRVDRSAKFVVDHEGSDISGAEKLLDKIERHLIDEADVVITTCITSYDLRLINKQFDAVIIDECTQSLEPESLCAIGHGCQHVVLIGDHKQLGPTLYTLEARRVKYNRSLYERLMALGMSAHTLTVQYRMHPALCSFSSQMFYDGQISSGVQVSDRTLVRRPGVGIKPFPWPNGERPTFFWHVVGTQEFGGSSSYKNSAELNIVFQLVQRLNQCFRCPSASPDDETDCYSIGVITPYDYQRSATRDELMSPGRDYSNVEVDSVDAFQGREKDIVILSTVRSANDGSIGFLSDTRRLNVAITRARYSMIVVGNALHLSQDSTWRDFILHFHEHGALVEGDDIDDLKPLGFDTLNKITNRKKPN
ncbi:Regulator of nonsense transcripts 1-like protein [Giardia muris]|uniref:Regulator of nonsense transcripts 1-like protein n=1 Tax=Giardia muris TaxID=5742 RepID=A0A4Z1SN03_GIAMU|nr:Regulator of nonsense transcripts 1-like protein [Giardia muris]|eukprot:TNJ27086.1 Regulator of nonsense transcripts 1-like protein [Giardia muris]